MTTIYKRVEGRLYDAHHNDGWVTHHVWIPEHDMPELVSGPPEGCSEEVWRFHEVTRTRELSAFVYSSTGRDGFSVSWEEYDSLFRIERS